MMEVKELTYLDEDHFLTDRADAVGIWGGVSVGVNTHTGFFKIISHDWHKYFCKLMLNPSDFTIGRRREAGRERERQKAVEV